MDGVINNKVNAVAGEEAELKCTVANARPKPAVLWKIGDREIADSFRTTTVSMDDDLATIVDTLRYPFAASDHGQLIRCVTAGSWIVVGQDEYDAFAQLDIVCKLISWLNTIVSHLTFGFDLSEVFGLILGLFLTRMIEFEHLSRKSRFRFRIVESD